jgi:hypothetical protein
MIVQDAFVCAAKSVLMAFSFLLYVGVLVGVVVCAKA